MKFPLLPALLLTAVLCAACTESFEHRCQREAREYTKKQCPRFIDKEGNIIMDSMTFGTAPLGFTYHYHVQGQLDNREFLTDEMLEQFKEDLLSSVRQDISLKAYKEKGFTFTYRYLSSSTGEVFTEAVITPKDYR